MPKPHIDEVALAFHCYHEAIRRVCREYLRHPETFKLEATLVQTRLKDQLAQMKLASLIDWTEKD